MSNAAYKKYKTTSIQSASREKILLMLYEGAIKFTKLAIQGVEQNNVKDKCENIGRAYDIVLELNNTLDHKVGGEVATRLEQLYQYMIEQYIKANASSDTEPLKINQKLLETLHEGWVQAIQKLKNETK
ncbi:MAG: flagellar export chaperone FliS [Bdellovibrionota bacterium]